MHKHHTRHTLSATFLALPRFPMLNAPLFSAMFSYVGVLYGIVAPLVLVQVLALLILTSMMNRDARPKEVAQAVYCFAMMGIGVLLMSAGALPTVISVLAGVKLTGATYFTLLIIFAAGGTIFLWHDAMVRDVPERSREVSETVFLFLFKIAGHLLVFLWSLSVIVTLLNGLPLEQGWWIMPVVMIAYGMLFIWCTRPEEPVQPKTLWKRIASQTMPTQAPTMKPWSPATSVVKAPAKQQSASLVKTATRNKKGKKK